MCPHHSDATVSPELGKIIEDWTTHWVAANHLQLPYITPRDLCHMIARDAFMAGRRRLITAVDDLMAPVETASNRCLAADGPVGDDLLMVAQTRDLRRPFDRAYQRLKKEVQL